MKKTVVGFCFLVVCALGTGRVFGIDGYTDTPMLPGGKWHVHDPNRLQPPVVAPPPSDKPGGAPADAVVLFDGGDLSKWSTDKGEPVKWKVMDGAIVVEPRTGDIYSRDKFGDCQLHIEFATPTPAKGSGQGRGNSGVFFMDRYEIQVLDCHENQTYPDGMTAAIYGQFPPLVNACRPAGAWQSYDIVFTAPKFEGEKLAEPAYVTVMHNGVLVHNHQALLGPMTFRGLPQYKPHADKGSIRLQDHGNLTRFRNIWVRPLERQQAQ